MWQPLSKMKYLLVKQTLHTNQGVDALVWQIVISRGIVLHHFAILGMEAHTNFVDLKWKFMRIAAGNKLNCSQNYRFILEASPSCWVQCGDGNPSDQHEQRRRPHGQDARHRYRPPYADHDGSCGAASLCANGLSHLEKQNWLAKFSFRFFSCMATMASVLSEGRQHGIFLMHFGRHAWRY